MLELCTFYFSVGGMPDGLKLGIVNEELGNFSSCTEYIEYLGEEYGGKSVLADDGLPYCLMQGLSCKFLESFNDTVAIKVRVNSEIDQKTLKYLYVVIMVKSCTTGKLSRQRKCDEGCQSRRTDSCDSFHSKFFNRI